MRRLLPRLRDERGFSLPELVVTMLVGTIVISAALGLLEFAMKRANDVNTRIDANQRGRLAMDTLTRSLRSQVCLTAAIKPLVVAKANEITFYGDLRDNVAGPAPVAQKRTLRFDTATSTLVELVSTGTENADETFSWGTAKSRTLLTNVVQDGNTPFFRFYAFTAAVPPVLTPVTPATGQSLIQADMDRIAKVAVQFKANPSITGASANSAVVLTDDIYSRLVNPNRAKTTAAPKPECT